MGYFSNGTEGEMYEDRYCNRCIHGGDACAVWGLHLIHNYDQHDNPLIQEILEELIPREGVFNGQCKMFVPKSPSDS